MCKQDDQEARRANERARWHRRAEERREKGMCLTCGRRPTAPDRTRCDPCACKRREADRERHRRRTEVRIAEGLCPRCGKTEPEPGLKLCASCNGKRNHGGRARDARLRAEGTPRRDPAKAREYERERSRRLYAERVAVGTCTKCGKAPARPDRTTCEPCAEKHRERDRERLVRAKAEGLPYGGRDPKKKREAGRKHGRRRTEARRAAGLCIRCGNAPPAEGRSMCEPCREDRRAAKRARHRERRVAGPSVSSARRPPPGARRTAIPALPRGTRVGVVTRRRSGRRIAGDTNPGAPRAIARDAGNRPTGRPSAGPAVMPPGHATSPAALPGNA